MIGISNVTEKETLADLEEVNICDIVVEKVSTEISDDNEIRKIYRILYSLVAIPYFGPARCWNIILIGLIVGIAFLIAACLTVIIALSGVSKLHSKVAQLDDRVTDIDNRLELQVANSTACLKNISIISNSKSILMCFFNQIFAKVTENTNIAQITILVGVLKETRYPFASCAAIQQLSPLSPSGFYQIRSSNGSAVRVYCDMTRSCGNITGGWMRVADLDTRDYTAKCPIDLILDRSQIRTCRTMNSGSAICSSDIFTVSGVRYSKVCGRIRAYQVGSPDIFGNNKITAGSGRDTENPNIETNYVDGVSLTHGKSPRQHIWTFVATSTGDSQTPKSKCPCINSKISSMFPPFSAFVGQNYFCGTGTEDSSSPFYSADPLWDGAGCGPMNTCCSFNNPPWFYKQLPQSTTDDIEMRVCHDEGTANDIAIEIVEIYIQ